MPIAENDNLRPADSSRRNFLCAGAVCAAAGLLPACVHAQSKPAAEAAKPAEGGKPPDDSLIGYCGYDCGLCPGRSADKERRLKMIEGWNKIYGHHYTPDKVPGSQPCAGCKGHGELADKECQARPCAMEKGVRFCAECGEFPCPKVRNLLGDRNLLLLQCFRRPDATREEFELCAKQFESLPNVIRVLIERGKMPGWVKEVYHHG